MGHFSRKWCVLIVSALLLENAIASNLRWVAASRGEVPEYAVVGGENFSGETLYVARVSLHSGRTPGKMAPSYRVAHTSYGGRELYKSDYEILTNPGWRSHLEWKQSSGDSAPDNAVVGGTDAGRNLYVARFMYGDGHMICGKALYEYQKAYIGYNNKEFESTSFYVLVEHPRRHIRGLAKRSFPELPDAKQLKRAPILEQQDDETETA